MAREFTELQIKLVGGPAPTPYRWEIYQGSNPIWIERSAREYPTEDEALRDGQMALERLKNREMQTGGR